MNALARRSAAAEVIAPELVRRFASDLARLWPESSDRDARLGIAVSGGPDSFALLTLACEALPGRIAAATVDHNLRAESAAEAATVAVLCEDRRIPHAVLGVRVPPGNVQAGARAARYAALADWAQAEGLAAVATAHHADDQAETLLMRLNRGSGLAGLAGIRARLIMGGNLTVLRPLLGWRKAELEAVCRAAGLVPLRDPGNSDPQFDRVAIRRLLQDNPLLDAQALARSAMLLKEADDALSEWLEVRWNADVRPAPGGLCYRPKGSRLVRMKLLERAVATFGGTAGGSALANLLDRLEEGGSGNIAGVQITPANGDWLIRPERPRRA